MRKRTIKIIKSFFLFFCAVSTVAIVPAVSAASNVSEIEAKYQSINDLQANFTQSTYIAALETKVQEPGIFSMKKPGMLRIEYTGDHPKKYISNGKKMWVIDAETKETETYDVSDDTMPKEALEFLNGFGDMEKLFTVKQEKTTKNLILTPKAQNAQYSKLECEFGPDNLLKAMVIHNKSGNISTYVFNSIRVNTGLVDKLFKN